MASQGNAKTHIKEIILENFMSYDYARIPLKPGLNVISGPNGAGKSSILLALSVALGQSHTERSRKLSDLIRRGEEMARVSVVFDNSPVDGRRPISDADTDSYVLSRYLQEDGTYWHEANYETVTKEEVKRILSQLSINPDNMLIVMHQGMIDVFGAIDAQERLKTVEEAVGLSDYRNRIFEAQENLSHKMSEEESINEMLQEAQETLDHWEEEYERYKKKQNLLEKKEDLEREYAWAKWWRQKERVDKLDSKVREKKEDLKQIERDLEKTKEKKKDSKEKLDGLEQKFEDLYRNLVHHEKEKSRAEAELDLIEKIGRSKLEGLAENSRDPEEAVEKAEEEIEENRNEIAHTKEERNSERESYIDHNIREAILGFRRERTEEKIDDLKKDLRKNKRELEELEAEAKEKGSKMRTDRKSREILEEIRVTNAKLAGLDDVSKESEKMYQDHKERLEELEEKAKEAEENRKKALEKLELRQEKWRSEIQELLKKVRETYRQILERVNAVGDVRMINPNNIEESGLELTVGFRGAEPQTLDAYTQSGGERSTSIMCFLLALQQHIKSPIRALDEFELHMDPRNRQMMMRELLNLMEESNSQYLVITPGRLVEIEKVPNVIAVQNSAGSSEVKVAT